MIYVNKFYLMKVIIQIYINCKRVGHGNMKDEDRYIENLTIYTSKTIDEISIQLKLLKFEELKASFL